MAVLKKTEIIVRFFEPHLWRGLSVDPARQGFSPSLFLGSVEHLSKTWRHWKIPEIISYANQAYQNFIAFRGKIRVDFHKKTNKGFVPISNQDLDPPNRKDGQSQKKKDNHCLIRNDNIIFP